MKNTFALMALADEMAALLDNSTANMVYMRVPGSYNECRHPPAIEPTKEARAATRLVARYRALRAKMPDQKNISK